MISNTKTGQLPESLLARVAMNFPEVGTVAVVEELNENEFENLNIFSGQH